MIRKKKFRLHFGHAGWTRSRDFFFAHQSKSHQVLLATKISGLAELSDHFSVPPQEMQSKSTNHESYSEKMKSFSADASDDRNFRSVKSEQSTRIDTKIISNFNDKVNGQVSLKLRRIKMSSP